jgi:hypothetical protein
MLTFITIAQEHGEFMNAINVNDLKKQHNKILEEGKALYEELIHKYHCLIELQAQIEEIEGDEYDPVPLLFGAGFYINENEEK